MVKKRIRFIQSQLEYNEAVIITGDANRLYFTGFASSAGTLLITNHSADFIIDFRYYEKAHNSISHCNVVLAEKLYMQLRDLLNKHNITTIYMETSYISLKEFETFCVELSDFVVSSDNKIDTRILQLRSIKSDEELKAIKEAQKITDDTFNYILERIKPGRTEREIMLEMEFFLRKQGSQGVSFDFIVVSGKNSSLPHGVPTDKEIEPGDFVTMDFGAVINGYRSDMTRTIAVTSISEEQRHVYNTVLEAQNEAFKVIQPGTPCIDVDSAARNYIYSNNYEGCFGHGLGHSIGIEVHESPCFNTRDHTLLEPGMILSVEPGIYLPEKFGVRIEDLVYITENGFENITKSPKELIIL